MLNQQSKKMTFLHFLFDVLIVGFSWILAISVRFLMLADDLDGFYRFLYLTPVPLIVAAGLLYRERFYIDHSLHAWHKDLSRLLIMNLQLQIFFILTGYNIQSERISRLTLLLFFLFCQIFLTANRIAFRNHVIKERLRGKSLQYLFIIGQGSHVERFVNKVLSSPLTGMAILGWADSGGVAEKMAIPSFSEEEMDDAIEKLAPHNIVLGYTGNLVKKQERYIKTHYNQVTPIILIPQLNYTLLGARIEDFHGVPLININTPSQSHMSLIYKRMLDLIGSGIGLIILSPFLLIIALLVKITSPGPIFYGQERMTTDGKIFTMWKFRSMKQGADNEKGFTWTVENDPRRTGFGTFLRKTSIDEFPQLWNVFLGDMSLVGPRPERPELIEGFKDTIPGYMLRHKMPAGITGWAQVNGWRGNTSLEKRIEFDMYYIRNWTFFLDIKILLLTITNGFINKNAY
jgi:exopolysaccharide biosynthesis polyprenyl glycosylphosphotransferase